MCSFDLPAVKGLSPLSRLLAAIERAGNALPHPATLFALLAVCVILLSAASAALDLRVTHPTTGRPVEPVNLLTVGGLHRLLTHFVTNFTGFAPLGTVLVALLGIGVAEASGLLGAALRQVVLAAPRRLLTVAIVFAGVMSNVGSEIGYVLLVPLSAEIFRAAGRHPLAGLAAAFAGVSGGYSANLLLGTIDPLLAGLSQEAARIVDPSYRVNPACNYYFMAASTFLITAVGTLITERVVAPRLSVWHNTNAAEELKPLAPVERRGLRWAAVAAVAFAAWILWGAVPADGFLRDPATRGLLHSPLLTGIVALIFTGGLVTGLAYGLAAGTFRRDADVIHGMSKAMSTLAGYLVLVFFAAQFVALFQWTNLGLILAVKGAELLRATGFGGIPLMLTFVLLSAGVNLFMGSASAKWAIMAPVFVPMFMLAGYSPELTQAAYRVGDSVTNIISPMMSYFALIVAFMQRYQPGAGIGTVIATMLPYTIAFVISWSSLLGVWLALGLPLGPGAPLEYRLR
ncbi:MAG: AbgT family transporter [Bryobacterales bacterium]|nr:AbgT family transporter [Bryobacteraceae bacterium]MDW8353797.1 AbgT family transporter [Bryobacterales bacterium]